MVMQGRSVRVADEDAEPGQPARWDFEAQGVAPRKKRPGPRPATPRDRMHRKWAAWAAMRRAGMTYAEIAEATDYSIAAIHHGVKKVRFYGEAVLAARESRYGL